MVPLSRVVDTGLFSMEKSENSPLWMRELQSGGHANHTPETEEYGIKSWIYRRNIPFHPERFLKTLEGQFQGAVRSKGHFWLASRMAQAGSWAQASRIARFDQAGFWWAAVSKSQWLDGPEFETYLKGIWQEPFGDRRQEIVFIGAGMDQAAITARLDAALLTDAEMALGPEAWHRLPDPFPAWAHNDPAALDQDADELEDEAELERAG